MDGVIVYDDKARFFQIYCSDDIYHLLQAGENLEVKVKGNWVQTIVERRTEDDMFGWWFADIGSCAENIGHSARIA